MLEKENAFYEANKVEFREKYLDKWLVIVDESLWGVFDKISEAAKAALEHFDEKKEIMIHRPSDDGKIVEIGPITSVNQPFEYQIKEPNSTMIVAEGELIKYPYAQ